jgi:hypothetical protein
MPPIPLDPSALIPVRQFLDKVDTLLMELDHASRCNAMNVLSALRGPDKDEDKSYKAVATCVIREAAFPKTFEMGACNVDLDCNWIQKKTVTLHRDYFTNHFHNHLYSAARVLGLEIEM